jgi:hypothetical protein
MQVTPILTLFLLGRLALCAAAVQPEERFKMADLTQPFEEKLRREMAAPVIVLGRILEVDEVGSARPSRTDPQIKLQLTRITLQTDRVVKGTVPGTVTTIYYYCYSVENERDLGIPSYQPQTGQVRLFFLEPYGSGYRSIGDVADYTLRVTTSGQQLGFCNAKDPGCCIAELLLSPGPTIDVPWFVHDLGPNSYAAGTVCSPAAAKSLVNELLKNSDMRVAAAAQDAMDMVRQWWPVIR